MAKPSSTNCPKAFRAAGFRKESGGDKKIQTDSEFELLINDFCHNVLGRRGGGARVPETWLKKSKAVIARGFHPSPFRTGKLSPATPMVLVTRRVGSRPLRSAPWEQSEGAFFYRHRLCHGARQPPKDVFFNGDGNR